MGTLMGGHFGFLSVSTGAQYGSQQANYMDPALLESNFIVVQTLLT